MLVYNIKWIARRSDSTLYMVTRQGLFQFNNNRFSTIPETPPELNDRIYDILASKDILYIATKSADTG